MGRGGAVKGGGGRGGKGLLSPQNLETKLGSIPPHLSFSRFLIPPRPQYEFRFTSLSLNQPFRPANTAIHAKRLDHSMKSAASSFETNPAPAH